MQRLEHIPGPMPWPMRAMLEPDNQAEADAAARAVRHYAIRALEHTRAMYRSRGDERVQHARAVHRAKRAGADELRALAAPPKESTR